jgi:hydrogenase/urease accessory protein HupE
MKRAPVLLILLLAVTPAFAHVGVGSTTSFAYGLGHPCRASTT